MIEKYIDNDGNEVYRAKYIKDFVFLPDEEVESAIEFFKSKIYEFKNAKKASSMTDEEFYNTIDYYMEWTSK